VRPEVVPVPARGRQSFTVASQLSQIEASGIVGDDEDLRVALGREAVAGAEDLRAARRSELVENPVRCASEFNGRRISGNAKTSGCDRRPECRRETLEAVDCAVHGIGSVIETVLGSSFGMPIGFSGAAAQLSTPHRDG